MKIESKTKMDFLSSQIQDQNNRISKKNKLESWKVVNLGDVVRSVQINEYNPEEAGLSRYVAGEHIESENFFVTKYGEISEARDIIGSAFIRRFSKGQILYVTRRAYLRKAAIATFDGICSNATLVLEANGKGLVSELLPFILQSDKFIEYAIQNSVGSTNPYVRWRDLANYKFKLPSSDRQEFIAKVLWSIQKSYQKSVDLANKISILRKTLLNQLVTQGIKNTKFKKVKFGFKFIEKEIPESWGLLELGKLSTDGLKNGIFKKREEFGGGVPLVNVTDLFSENELISNGLERVNVNDKELDEFGVKNGDIFFCRSSLVKNGIGMSNIMLDLQEPTVFECHVIRLRPNRLIDPVFLFYFTRSQIARQFLLASSMSMTMTTIRQEDLEKLPVPIPPLDEQKKIVSLITKSIENFNIIKFHIEKLKQLRKNLSNQFLYLEDIVKVNDNVH